MAGANAMATGSPPPSRTAHVVACAVPDGSLLDRAMIDSATYRDAYRCDLHRAGPGITDIFLAVFAHHPRWMRWLLLLRHRVASLAGLDVPKAADVLRTPRQDRYAVGQTIGVWPIYALAEDEIIAGRDNRHLDFRVSVLRRRDDTGEGVVISTVCTAHNRAGRLYLALVVPFHRRGVRLLMERALTAGRL